jgi:hypothetical protein
VKNGHQESCFPAGDTLQSDNPDPTFILTKQECEANPGKYKYPATITYQICNNNEQTMTITSADQYGEFQFAKYKDSKALDDADAFLRFDNWVDPLPPKTCRSEQIKIKFRPCVHEKRVMEVAIHGKLPGGLKNFCNCFLRENALAQINNEPTPTPKPQTKPTPKPQPSPTAKPPPM